MEENEYHRQSLVLEALIGHDVWAKRCSAQIELELRQYGVKAHLVQTRADHRERSEAEGPAGGGDCWRRSYSTRAVIRSISGEESLFSYSLGYGSVGRHLTDDYLRTAQN
jgi:hypothetical protein